MNPAIGLVVALTAEARALIGRGRWHQAEGQLFRRICLKSKTDLLIVRSGLGTENAFLASQWLIGKGVVALGISGVSGGLDPDLAPGDLILADAVIEEGGNTYKQVWKGNPKFVEIVYAALMAKGIQAYRGQIITVRDPVLSAPSKQMLYRKTRALAVDMESAGAALAANEATLPFFAFRAVCDAAARSVPVEIFDCINQTGHVRLPHLFRMLLLRPAVVSDLLRTKRDFAKALGSLGRAWDSEIRRKLPALLLPRIDCTIPEKIGI